MGCVCFILLCFAFFLFLDSWMNAIHFCNKKNRIQQCHYMVFALCRLAWFITLLRCLIFKIGKTFQVLFFVRVSFQFFRVCVFFGGFCLTTLATSVLFSQQKYYKMSQKKENKQTHTYIYTQTHI